MKGWELFYSQQPYFNHKYLNQLGQHTLAKTPLTAVQDRLHTLYLEHAKATLSRQSSLHSIKSNMSFSSHTLFMVDGLSINWLFYGGVKSVKGLPFFVEDARYRAKLQERTDLLISKTSTRFCFFWNDCLLWINHLAAEIIRMLFDLSVWYPLFRLTFLVAHVSLISSPSLSPYSRFFFNLMW